VLDSADVRNATGLFGLNPTALIFGLWDSTGPRGGLGAKFQRALVSEMVGYGAMAGVKTSSRIDPAQIMKGAGPLYARKSESDQEPTWTLDKNQGGKKIGGKKGKEGDGNPSDANHSNIPPQINLQSGGFTITRAVQTTVLSLAALRRLRFPVNGGADSDPSVDIVARTALAAVGLAAATLTREQGADLRSRCQLVPTGAFAWELLGRPGESPKRFELTGDQAVELCNQAIKAVTQAGLPWEGEIDLVPSSELLELVRRSQQLAASEGEESD
jgi:CRISPR-associated protein Csb1